MRSEQLEYFVAVSRCHSMNLASEELYVSQQSLSASIKSLERELGVELLTRSHLGVKLTVEGQAFLKIASNFLDAVEEFKDDSQRGYSLLSGKLNVYCTPAICSSILPRMLSLYMKKYSNVEINIVEGTPFELDEIFMKDHEENKLLIFNVLNCNDDEISLHCLSDSLVYEEFLHENYVVVVEKSSVLADYKSISIKTLLHYPLVFSGTKTKDVNMSYMLLKKYGTPLACLVSDNPYIYIQAMVDGSGVGIMPTLTLQQELLADVKERLCVIPIKEKIESTSYWAVPKDQKNSDLLRSFIDFCNEHRIIFKNKTWTK